MYSYFMKLENLWKQLSVEDADRGLFDWAHQFGTTATSRTLIADARSYLDQALATAGLTQDQQDRIHLFDKSFRLSEYLFGFKAATTIPQADVDAAKTLINNEIIPDPYTLHSGNRDQTLLYQALDTVTAGKIIPTGWDGTYTETWDAGPANWKGTYNFAWHDTGGVNNSGYVETYIAGRPYLTAIRALLPNNASQGLFNGDIAAKYAGGMPEGAMTISFYVKNLTTNDPVDTRNPVVQIFNNTGSYEYATGTTIWSVTLPVTITTADWTLVTTTINTNWTDTEAQANGWTQSTAYGGNASWASVLQSVGSIRIKPSGDLTSDYIDDTATGGDPVGESHLGVDEFTMAKVSEVSGMMVNDGNPQRSMVNSLALTFSEAVSLSSGAIVLRMHDGSVIPNVNVAVSNPSGDLRTYHLSFSGSAIRAGSLPDGIYDLSVGGWMTSFHRLYGDLNGDKVVDELDLFSFRNSLNDPSTYVWYGDDNGDGKIDNLDLFAIRSRLAVSYVY